MNRKTLFLLCSALAGLISLGSTAPAFAQAYCAPPIPVCNPKLSSSSCYQPPPTPCQCGPKTCKKCTTSPVFAASGVYEIDLTDLSIPTSGFPLVASRRYSSAHQIDGPTGIGWSSTFHARLNYSTYLFAAPSTYQTEVDVIMPDGEHYTFNDAGGGVFTAPEGRYDTLVKNADGSFDLTLQRSRSVLHFGADGLLTSMADDFGNTLNYTYDTSSGRVQRVADAAGSGRYLDVIWGPNGRISILQDHTGRTVQYFYDAAGMLTSVTNPAGQTTTYSYVPGRYGPYLSQVKDQWNRVLTDLTWDAQGRVKSYSEEGETYTYTYAANGNSNWTAKADSAGNTWTFPTGNAGLIAERKSPIYPVSSLATYNPDGSIIQATDEVGIKTHYTYTGQGRVATVTKDYQGASSVRFDYTYDATFTDKVISILPKNSSTGANEPNWQGWKYDYYQAGSLTPGSLHHVYRVKSDGVTTETMATYVYDAKGRVASVTDAAGSVTDYVYDVAGNLQSVTAPSNNDAGIRPVTTYSYDTLGRVTTVTDPMGKATTYTYDVLDRMATVTLPKPVAGSPLNFVTTYLYDQYEAATGLLFTHVSDPNAILTKQGYDQFGRLRESIDALTNTTAYGYTKNLLTSITDANGNITSYEYDVIRRLSATVFPDGKRETYAYWNDNLLRSKTDRKGLITSYAYDAHKRLGEKTYPGGAWIRYTYTGQKLTQVSDAQIWPPDNQTFTHDSSFRVASDSHPTRGTLNYTYTSSDAAATMAVSGGPTTTYSYYPDGSVNTIAWTPIASGNFKYAYRLNGQYGTITFPNGQTRAHGYDDQGRLLQIANVHPTSGNLATFDYGYDVNHATGANDRMGQRVSMTANVPSQSLTNASTQYRYDTNYQLIQANYPSAAPFNGEAHAWTYDAIGNRLTTTVNGTTTSYTYQKIGTNPNNWQRLTNDGTSAYTYDFNGNTLTQGANTYGYDHESRMTSISGGVAATYRYDFQGRRTSKTVAGITTTYLYDGLNLIAESGPSTARYLFGPGIDEPLATERGGAVSYYAADGLGSINVLGDPAGTAQNSYAYDAWGSARSSTELVPQPFRYTARESGDLANQWFYRARFYAPGVGRFLSEDPLYAFTVNGRLSLGPASGRNLFPYVDNEPLTATDPMGLQAMAIATAYRSRRVVRHPSDFIDDMNHRADVAGPKRFPRGGPQRYPNWSNDQMRHCTTSCEAAQQWGEDPVRAAGVHNEVRGFVLNDRLGWRRRVRNGGPRAGEIEDLRQNERGFACSRRCLTGNCEQCCAGQ